MKTKLLLFAFALFFAPFLYGQMFFWESFDAGQMPPSGWSLNGLPAQWSIGSSNNAGGLAPEGKFTYENQNTTTRLISPMVNLTGLTTVKFSFKFFYDWYANPAPKIGVATRSHNGAWTSVWEMTPTGNVGPMQKDLDIANSDVGQDEFQVCIYMTGNLYNLDYVFVDNMLLFSPLNRDGAMISIGATPNYFSEPVAVKGTVLNTGTTTITDAVVEWQLDGGAIHSSTFTGLSIATQQMYDFTCTDLMTAAIGQHNLQVWIKSVNGSPDNDLTNDTTGKVVNKVCNTVPKVPLFEEFTSSTCGPCASFNTGFVPWCSTHEEDITLIKYQMNWPGSGDPYYTEEGGVRRDFYGVNAVPDLYCNGGGVATSMPDVEAAYNQALTQIGMMDLAVTHTMSGHVIDVTATILPYANFTNCNLYIVVMEKLTHNNATTNGETSFEHVMMKMIPDGSGTALNLIDRVPFSLSQQVDLTGTHVEEWDDLIVGVFVQDQSSKMVYQTTYSAENATLATEARLSALNQDGTLIAGFSPDVFDYDVHLPSGTTIVPEVTATAMDPNAIVIIVPSDELPGTTTVDVFAEDLIAHNLYTVNFMIGGVGIGDPTVKNVVAYPNPSKGLLFIRNAENCRISLSTCDGKQVRAVEQFTGTSLDLSGMPQGVYMLSVERPDHTVIRKKIVLL
jgi:hypothetical protein